MRNRYILDKDFSLRKVTRSIWGVVWTCVKWFVMTVSLAALAYIALSLFINTDEEKRLRRENRMYEKLYAGMAEKAELVSDVVSELELRDNAIYRQIFNSEAPSVDPTNSISFVFANDSIPDKDIVDYASRKSDSLLSSVSRVNADFGEIFAGLASGKSAMPPMRIPVEGLNFAQVGASVGMKINPFYKVPSRHDGVDLIVGQGTPVVASCDGVVADVIRSGKGMGNVVVIAHEGGYVTKYAHLEDIVVRKGEYVKAGKKIAHVGISGSSFAPHLHYEVHRDDQTLDPVNCFFASFSPKDYLKVAYMAATTGQSMD